MVSYTYFTNDYLGGVDSLIDSASFQFLEKKAVNYLNYNTKGAYLTITSETGIAKIKDCICALIEIYNDEQASMISGVFKQSENVGGHSVNYKLTDFEAKRKEVMSLYLWDLGITRSRKVFGIHEG